jgi:tetratricopeptide (TPR) repeat protein
MSPSNTLPIAQPDRRRLWLLGGVLVLIGLVAYLPMLQNGFVWDDDTFLTKNPLIKAPGGLFRFWFSTQPSDYWPVTSSTLWLEWRFWGMHAAGYHATNLALHLAEGLMLWTILRRLRVPGAYLAALLFVVHPVNVESVAWIAQRKNLMAMLFYLASLYCFVRLQEVDRVRDVKGEDKAGTGVPSLPFLTGHWYWLSLAAFLLAMLSKGSVATLPIVLLGIIAWRRRVTRRDIAELLPFFFVSAALIVVNIWFQTHGSGEIVRQANGLERLLGAGAVVWFYLCKALLPVNLTFVYPQWHIRADDLLWWLPLIGAIALTGLLWRWACLRPLTKIDATTSQGGDGRPARPDRPLARGALFAWLYFGVMLLPVMGFTDVYFMRYSLVADHYQHLAIIGLLAFAAAAWSRLPADPRFKFAAAAAVAIVLAALTWRQCGMYLDTPTLYRVTLDRNPDCWMVYNNLALSEADSGRLEDATRDFERALRLNPDFYEAHLNFGSVLLNTGHPAEAMLQYQQALQAPGDHPVAYYSLGNALHSLHRDQDAVAAYSRAVELRPDYPDAENNLGIALEALGRAPEAAAHYRRALELDPSNAAADYNLGNVLGTLGRSDEAVVCYQDAVRLRPDYYQAHNNLGIALANAGRFAEAAQQFQAALRADPNYTPAANNLARLQAMLQSSR